MDKTDAMRAGYFAAGTGLGCGFLPLDSFLLSLLPMMVSPWLLVEGDALQAILLR